MRKSALAVVALVVSALALTSCANTVTGVSKDVKATGHAVKKAVE